MSAAGRLGIFAVILAAAFGLAYVVAGAVVPDSVVQQWHESPHDQDGHEDSDQQGDTHGAGVTW